MQIIIRDLSELSEMQAAETLQQQVWQFGPLDTVSAGEMVAVREAGGTVTGAFAGDELVGFVYGFVGHEDGEVTIHSHLAAVKSEWRNRHIGWRLKLAQRQHALERDIRRITWTFDPLQSLNAWFNFARLGVIARKYRINFYGADVAILVSGIGTDRFWCEWPLEEQRVIERIEQMDERPESAAGYAAALPLVVADRSGWPALRETEAISTREDAPYLTIEIPREIALVQQNDQEQAREWRDVTRLAFTTALAAGYLVVEFARTDQTGIYLLCPAQSASRFGLQARTEA